jgi:AcrR family transcriptional regulator
MATPDGEHMATQTEPEAEPRIPLTRERVLRTAIALADESGLDAISMRKLGQALGVEAMSLYNHVANKSDLLDAMVDEVIDEIELPGGNGWKAKLRNRILSARSVMLRHKWAPAVIETRTTISPVLFRYFNGLLGELREGGFSYDLAHHSLHVLGSRALGFSQELFEPDDTAPADEDAGDMMVEMAAELPFLIEMVAEISHDGPDATIGWCDDQTEFVFGLDLILDGLERHRDAEIGRAL